MADRSDIVRSVLRRPFRRVRLQQVSAEMESWRGLGALPRGGHRLPHVGWIRYVREALGMNGYQLARRLGIAQPTVARLEQKERAETITVGALRRAAHGLDCDLVYVFVPRTTLPDVVAAQVRRAVAAALRRGSPATDPDELERELLVLMPGWIWGSAAYPELFGVGERARPGDGAGRQDAEPAPRG